MKLFSLLTLLLLLNVTFGQLTAANVTQIDAFKEIIASDVHDSLKISAYEDWNRMIWEIDSKRDTENLNRIDSICNRNLRRSLSTRDLFYFQEKKANALLRLGNIQKKNNDFKAALSSFKESRQIFQKLDSKNSLARVLNNEGMIFSEMGDFPSAIANYQKSIELFKLVGDSIGLSNGLNNSAIVHANIGDYDLSIAFFMESLKISEIQNDLKGKASALNNIGMVNSHQGDLDNALVYFKKSLALRIKGEDLIDEAIVYINIGGIYVLMDSNDLALDYFEKGKDLCEQIGNKFGLTESLNGIAGILIDRGMYQKAKTHLEEALRIAMDLESDYMVSSIYVNLGRVYVGQGNYKQGITLGEKSLAIANDIGALNRIEEASKYLYVWHKELGNSKSSLAMHELYITIRDSILREENQRELVKQEYKYQYEKQKSIDDAEFEKEKLLEKARTDNLMLIEKEKKQKQQIIIYSISLGLILLVIFLFFVFNRLNLAKKQKDEIGRQKLAIDEQHKELEETHTEITDSINYAKHLQAAIFPSFDDLDRYLGEHFILFKPKDVISGDFYWFERVNGVNYIAAADCTGHGVPGAILCVVCSNALNRSVNEYGLKDPNKILNKTRELVIETLGKSGDGISDGMDISLGALYPEKVVFSGANNPLWIIRKKTLLNNSELEQKGTLILGNFALLEYKGNKQPIGRYHSMADFTQKEITIFEDDRLYFFSDGYIDQFGGELGKKFKSRSLKNLLLETVHYSIPEQKIKLATFFEEWKGENEQLDDVCIIGLRIKVPV